MLNGWFELKFVIRYIYGDTPLLFNKTAVNISKQKEFNFIQE